MNNKDRKLSDRLEKQIGSYAKRLAAKVDPSLEQDFVQDMYVFWLEFDFSNEALLWTAIKREMSDIVFRSRKYRYSVSNLRFLSYEWLMEEIYQDSKRNHTRSKTDIIKKILELQLDYNIELDNTLLIHQLLKKLSDREKEAIILCYYQDLTGEEAGKQMKITRSMISRYKSRALDKMRRILDD